jgi:hypothetical protein
MKDVFVITPLTPGETVSMYGYSTLQSALEAAKTQNLTSFQIDQAVDDQWKTVCVCYENYFNKS